jgi:phage replication-related protein YjqB (UPF0714/DUF867 family)
MRFAELLARDGVEERVELRGRVGFLAFHGGNLERLTDEIASVAAARAGASLYAVVQHAPLREHLPSTEVTPEASPALASFLESVDVAIAVHGYGRDGFWTKILLGGTNRPFAQAVAARLDVALDGFDAVVDLDAIPKELRGQHALNPVNLPRHGGVQIELPPRVRGLTPHAASFPRCGEGRIPWTNRLIDALVLAAADFDAATMTPDA